MKMTPVERARQWRLDNLDRYRQYQREYNRRKRLEKKAARFKAVENPTPSKVDQSPIIR